MTAFLTKDELKELDRDLAFSVLTGSHNYNLNTENSDKDYKVFVYPRYEDFYFGFKQNKTVISETRDKEYKDIRLLQAFFSSGNFNCFELLFSQEVENNSNELYKDLVANRDEIIHSHLHDMFVSTFGMIHLVLKNQKINQTDKYNSKKLSHALRYYDMLEKYFNNDFSNFSDVIYYKNDDPMRSMLISLKNNETSSPKKQDIIGNLTDFLNDKISLNRNTWNTKAKQMFGNVVNKNIIKNDEFSYNKLVFEIVYDHLSKYLNKG